MDYGFHIDEAACECQHDDEICRRTVIRRRSGRDARSSFAIRRVSVDENQLERWDLSVFGQPRHPRYTTTGDPIKCRDVELEFRSVQERRTFNSRFATAIALRNDHAKEVQALSARAQSMSQRPGQAPPARMASSVSPNSSPLIRTSSSSPPVVGPIASFPVFNERIFHEEEKF